MRSPSLAAALWLSLPAFADVAVTNRWLEPRQTVSQALRKAGVSKVQAHRLVDALDDVFDVRQAHPRDQLRIVWQDGFVERLDYRVGRQDEYQVRREGWRYAAHKRAPVLERTVERLSFDVETSLYEAATSTGRDPTVAMALADAFGWELDLAQHAQLGDRAVVLVESLTHQGRRVRYGDVLAASYAPMKGNATEVFRYELPSGERGWYFADGTSAQRTFLKNPVPWAPLTSTFGYRLHPLLQQRRFHDGVDYSMPVGTPVRAVATGLVSFAGWVPGGGNMVCLLHRDEYESCYLHLSKLAPLVQVDAVVYRQQLVAWSGNTGASTRPHLHFNLKHRGRYVNPLQQHFPRTEPLPTELMPSFAQVVASYSAKLHQPVPVLAQ